MFIEVYLHIRSISSLANNTNICFIFRDTYPMLLVANKVDLVHLRKITEEQGRDLAHKLGIPYIETSAKDPPLNIDATFHEVSRIYNVYLVLLLFFVTHVYMNSYFP